MPEQAKTPTSCNIRGHVWQLLLGCPSVSSAAYLQLVSLGPCALYSKIRGDVFRTFQADAAFWAAVNEAQLSRVLNTFVWQQQKHATFRTASGGTKASPFTYMQGMNALAGVFLSCMTELEAFSAFQSFVTEHTPLYWTSSHIGANAGCKLVDQILAVVDPPLAQHLSDTTPGAYVYAFHCVSSFCATIRPLSEVVKLWDFLLVVGVQWGVLCVAAQVVLLRDKLLASQNPKAILDYRVWPALDASVTVGLALQFLPSLPTSLYNAIRDHATVASVAEQISGTTMHENSKDIVFGWSSDAARDAASGAK
jgi:cell cycle arrest protein BUB2